MTYKKSIWAKIGKNTPLRLKLALALGMTENGVIKAIEHKRSCLTEIAAVKVVQEELGLTEDQLFENQVA